MGQFSDPTAEMQRVRLSDLSLQTLDELKLIHQAVVDGGTKLDRLVDLVGDVIGGPPLIRFVWTQQRIPEVRDSECRSSSGVEEF